MRPEWLKCETCLFYAQDGSGYFKCFKSPRPLIVYPLHFCGSWACRRCLQPWRQLKFQYYSPERQWGLESALSYLRESCEQVRAEAKAGR